MRYAEAVFTDHARVKMARREVTEEQVLGVLARPESDQLVRPGRRVLQGQMLWGSPPQPYLLRVFADVDRNPPEIVTVYLTSKFANYGASP